MLAVVVLVHACCSKVVGYLGVASPAPVLGLILLLVTIVCACPKGTGGEFVRSEGSDTTSPSPKCGRGGGGEEEEEEEEEEEYAEVDVGVVDISAASGMRDSSASSSPPEIATVAAEGSGGTGGGGGGGGGRWQELHRNLCSVVNQHFSPNALLEPGKPGQKARVVQLLCEQLAILSSNNSNKSNISSNGGGGGVADVNNNNDDGDGEDHVEQPDALLCMMPAFFSDCSHEALQQQVRMHVVEGGGGARREKDAHTHPLHWRPLQR